MDMQALINAISESARSTRSQYQLTLGAAIEKLGGMDAKAPIHYEDGKAPGKAMSYRGYYSDLSFSDADSGTVGGFLSALKEAHGKTFEGYKGGDNTMGDDAPVWRSEYGTSSGVAMMDVVPVAGNVLIVTKQVD